MPLLPVGVFDATITDPPWGIGIAPWDRETPGADVWREVLRVMKPGAALVAFAGRQTYHKIATEVEAAGLKVVDQALWIFQTGRPPSRNHLRPAHELILVARAPGPRVPLSVEDARIPWRDVDDRKRVARIDSLRRDGSRRQVYKPTLSRYGRESFTASDGGRWPTTVMSTSKNVLECASHVFLIPKIRNVVGHPCVKPVELFSHLIRLFVPIGGVLLDPFAGSGPVATAVESTGRKAVLIETGPSARD